MPDRPDKPGRLDLSDLSDVSDVSVMSDKSDKSDTAEGWGMVKILAIWVPFLQKSAIFVDNYGPTDNPRAQQWYRCLPIANIPGVM